MLEDWIILGIILFVVYTTNIGFFVWCLRRCEARIVGKTGYAAEEAKDPVGIRNIPPNERTLAWFGYIDGGCGREYVYLYQTEDSKHPFFGVVGDQFWGEIIKKQPPEKMRMNGEKAK